MKTKNQIMMDGTVIRISQGRTPNRTIFTIMSASGKRRVFVPFVYNKKFPEDIKQNDKVHVEGHIISYREWIREEKENRNVQYFAAESITKQRSELEQNFGVKGNYYVPDRFVGYFAGVVVRRIDGNDTRWGKLLVQVDGDRIDRKVSRIVFNYPKSNRMPDFDFQPEDNVYIVANISTPTKEINGKNYTYHDLIVNDIVRLPVESGELSAPEKK